MRIFGIMVCLVALGLTGYAALTIKAPQIEAEIEGRSERALAALVGDEVDIRADGRHVTISGRVADNEQRLRILSIAATVPGALGPIDALDTAEIVAPYRFDAAKDEDGSVRVEGFAPTVAMKTAIEQEARDIFGDAAEIKIDVAAGVPEGNWKAAASSAMDALATMRQGRLSFVDADAKLEGDVALEADLEAIDIFAQSMPEEFSWTHEVGVYRGTVEPFTFSATKDPEAGLRLSGFAPDDETRKALVDKAKAIAGSLPVVAEIQIAGGMPDAEWPSLVFSGLNALEDVDAGGFDVVGNDVSFSGNPVVADEEGRSDDPAGVEADAEATAQSTAAPVDGTLDAALAPDADSAEISAAASALSPTLTIEKAELGTWSIRGAVPDQQAEDKIVSLVKNRASVDDIDVDLDRTGGDDGDDWLRFAEDRLRALDEVRAGQLSLDGFNIHLIGVVETQDDVEPIQTALASIDQGMTVDLQAIDPRLSASLDMNMSAEEGVRLSGTLPSALTEGEALLALGVRRYDGKLEGNGRGRAETWWQDLSEIGKHLSAFEDIEVSLGGPRPIIRGKVEAQRDAGLIAEELMAAFGPERQPLVEIETTEKTREDGDARTNPLTRKRETYHAGYWLPAVDFVADEQTCREQATAMQAKEKITFLRGQEDLDHRAEGVLNALAAVAIRCLDRTDLVLEIGGHTDSRGAAQMNEELSQARADAVRDALVDRGVDATSLTTVGFGPSQPIADNATDEGRAANRRITFEWKAADDIQNLEAEG